MTKGKEREGADVRVVRDLPENRFRLRRLVGSVLSYDDKH